MFIINPISIDTQNSINTFIDSLYNNFAGNESNLFIYTSKYPRDSISAIRKYTSTLDEGQGIRIYAVGGDGILFDCLNGVVGLNNVELGSIPYGKSNDFIRAFGEGLYGQFKSIENQVNGSSISTDVIYCGNNYALNCCSVGMESYAVHKFLELKEKYGYIINTFPRPIARFLYNFTYFLGGVLAIKNKKIINQYYQITIDNQDFSGQYAMINIANGPCYGGDKCATPFASPADGYLDIIMFKSTDIFEFVSKGLDYLYSKFYKYPELISYYRFKEASIKSELPLVLQLDGEVFLDTNIFIKIIPNAIKFISVNGYKYKKHSVNKFDESNIKIIGQ
jgi:diacylglycerol kinase family enzyme